MLVGRSSAIFVNQRQEASLPESSVNAVVT